MAEVVVIGAGIAGMAAAARLAKLGHRVTLFEREEAPGGAVRALHVDGFSWDLGPSYICLPAVLRDLFRKSGRPLERYVDLQMPAIARRHVFADGAVVDLPSGSRAHQTRAVGAGLGAGAGSAWTGFVDAHADIWDQYRRSADGPDAPVDDTAGPAPSLPRGSSLGQAVTRLLPDPRLQDMATWSLVLGGSRLQDVPAWASLPVYLERTFGLWTLADGASHLTDVLVTRLAERHVEVRYAAPVGRILHRSGRVRGVALLDGTWQHADYVVAAVEPLQVFTSLLVTDPGIRERLSPATRTLRSAVRVFEAAARTIPAAVTHLGLRGPNPAGTAAEIILHGDPPIAVRTTGGAPDGHRAWSIWRRGISASALLPALADRGLDLRAEVVVRSDRSPDDIAAEPGSAWFTSVWDGASAQARRATFAAPLPGLYAPGASMSPDASLPQALWTAANVANRIGKASPG